MEKKLVKEKNKDLLESSDTANVNYSPEHDKLYIKNCYSENTRNAC